MIRPLPRIENVLVLTALLAGAPAIAGCSSDDSPAQTPTGTGGASASGGAGGGTGGRTGTGGKAGTGGKTAADAGATGGRAADDASADGGEVPDASTDAGDASLPPLPALTGKAFVVASDFVANEAEVKAVDLATGAILGGAPIHDGDPSVRVSGDAAFVLERNASALDVLTPTGAVSRRIALADAPDGAPAPYLNPHDVVSVSGTKAYVSLYGANALLVVDPTTGTVTKTIDLAAFMESTDTDGSSEPDAGYFDAATKRAYFLLQRIDVSTITMQSNYIASCLPGGALVVALDTDTDTFVDLNGADAGLGIELPLPSPTSWTRTADGKLFVVSDGCATGPDGGVVRARSGVSVVDVGAGTATAVYASTSQDFLSDLLPVAGTSYALVGLDGATYETTYTLLDTASVPAVAGARLANVPGAMVAAGNGQFVGIDFESLADGGVGQILSQYDTNTQRSAKVVSLRWSGSYSYAAVTVAE